MAQAQAAKNVGSATVEQAHQVLDVSKAFFTLARVLDRQTEDVAGSQAQTWLMVRLAEPGDHTLKDLSHKLRVSPPSLCLMLKRLTAEGLVDRLTHPTDKRRAMYRLTTEGMECLEAMRVKRRGILAQLMGIIPPERLDCLMEDLTRVGADLQLILSQVDTCCGPKLGCGPGKGKQECEE